MDFTSITSHIHNWMLFLLWLFLFILSEEGNGTPLQYSCLENPMDGGAWWAAVHGVMKSRTQLTSLLLFTSMHWWKKWQPTPVFLPGNPRDRGAWWAAIYGVAQSRTRLKWLSCSSSFILSGVISPLISSSILGTYQPEEFIFQCAIFLPFHTVHGVLKVRILKWFAIPFSSGPHFVRTVHHDPSISGGPTGHGSQFHWVIQSCPQNSPGKKTGVGSHSLLQGILPDHGSNPGLPHYRWILYHLSHQGSPYTLY